MTTGAPLALDSLRRALGEGVRLAVAAIVAPTDELVAALAPSERVTLATLRSAKRRRDWLAGRLAAKRAVADLLGASCAPPPAGIVVTSDDASAPHVRAAGAPDLALSIAHSAGWGCAVAGISSQCGRLGVDLELAAGLDPESLWLVFGAEERAWLAREPWSTPRAFVAKEAVAKLLGVGFQLEPTRLRVAPWPGSSERVHVSLDERATYVVETALVGSYVAAFARESRGGSQRSGVAAIVGRCGREKA